MAQTEKEQKEISYEYAVVCSMITTITACTLLAPLEAQLKDDNFFKATRHNLKLSNGEYHSWTDRVFYFDKYSKNKCEDIRRILDQCKMSAEALSNDVMLFRINVVNYLFGEDVVCANTLAYMVVVCSLLKFSIDICYYAKKHCKLSDSQIRTLDIVAPKQLFNNVKGIYHWLPVPSDVDFTQSTNVNSCMDRYSDSLFQCYITFFTDERKSEN